MTELFVRWSRPSQLKLQSLWWFKQFERTSFATHSCWHGARPVRSCCCSAGAYHCSMMGEPTVTCHRPCTSILASVTRGEYAGLTEMADHPRCLSSSNGAKRSAFEKAQSWGRQWRSTLALRCWGCFLFCRCCSCAGLHSSSASASPAISHGAVSRYARVVLTAAPVSCTS